jgi:anti-sigma factor RsiW
MSDCREWRGELAATAAGAPDPDKQLALAAHLDGCRHCREELVELKRVASTLSLVDADRLANPPRPPASLAGDVVAAVAELRQQRAQSARWRNVLVSGLAAAAVFAVILSIVAVTVGKDGSGSQYVAFEQTPPGVAASVELSPASWGTAIELEVAGLDGDGDIYWLWLSTEDGERIAAGTFSGDGTVHMAAALPLDRAARVWVTNADDAVVLDTQLH